MTENPATRRSELALLADDGCDLEGARAMIERSLKPAQKRDLVLWLGGLRIITIHRSADEIDEGMIARIYVERLSLFPADIVEHAMLTERWKFFPMIAELEDKCEALLVKRKLVWDFLCGGHVRRRAELPALETRAPPLEDRQRIVAEVLGPNRVFRAGAGPVSLGAAAAAAVHSAA